MKAESTAAADSFQTVSATDPFSLHAVSREFSEEDRLSDLFPLTSHPQCILFLGGNTDLHT